MTETTDVHIEQWLEDAQTRLSQFVASWIANNKTAPDQWPMAMSMGEWDEQYRCAEGG